MKKRGELLRIFEVKADKGIELCNSMQNIMLMKKYKAPTQAEIHLALTSKEKKTGLLDGALQWLASGISLEKAQYVIIFIPCRVGDFDRKSAPFRDKLRAEVRQLSAHSSVSKCTSVATSRQKLGRKIEAFHAKGSAFLGDINDGGDDISFDQMDCEEDNILDVDNEINDLFMHSTASDDASDEESEDSEEEDEEEDEEDEAITENPECLRLAMPSSLGRECIVRLGLETLAMQGGRYTKPHVALESMEPPWSFGGVYMDSMWSLCGPVLI